MIEVVDVADIRVAHAWIILHGEHEEAAGQAKLLEAEVEHTEWMAHEDDVGRLPPARRTPHRGDGGGGGGGDVPSSSSEAR